jgi:hypothetical protein
MTLPTPEQLDAEADRQYWLSHPAPSDDAAEGAPVVDEASWREIREQVLCDWTAGIFNDFFPTAGALADDDTVLIEYWNDIKQQISGGPGRWSWDEAPDHLAP